MRVKGRRKRSTSEDGERKVDKGRPRMGWIGEIKDLMRECRECDTNIGETEDRQ